MIREQIKKTAGYSTTLLPFSFLRKMTGQHFIFPFYHFAGKEHPPFLRHLYAHITPAQFLSDLEFLLKHYQPASVSDLKNFTTAGKKSKKPLFFLSFDDGLKACYEVIYPVLKQKGIPAAFFINPDFIDNKELFYRFSISLIIDQLMQRAPGDIPAELKAFAGSDRSGRGEIIRNLKKLNHRDDQKITKIAAALELDPDAFLSREKPYMTMQQLKKLDAEGFVLGSHSMNHPLFSESDTEEQIKQIADSIDFVKTHFAPEISLFAFPFTDFGVPSPVFDFIDRCEKIDISFGTAGLKNDDRCKHIQRIPMETPYLRGGQKILRAEYSYYLLKSLFGRNRLQH